MVARLRSFWQALAGSPTEEAPSRELPTAEGARWEVAPPIEIAPNDPILTYFLSSSGVVEIDKLQRDSPALREMKAAGIKLSVPLIGQGELIGLLNLGPRLSEQEYSADDRRLLSNLATQAAPALRVAQMVRQQQEEAQERERLEQELRVARVIQQTLLPKELPAPAGWQVAAHWQPARAVGGDFYDFLTLPDGKIGFVVGDVTDKGVPAAMVMATTRSILRTAVEHASSPGQVLGRANDLLCPDIPQNMFVTCLYAVLDPQSGHLCFANAGHNIPVKKHGTSVEELRATGMPLGLMPGMDYEEKETTLTEGDCILFYSDGLVEAHNRQREMFGVPRLCDLIAGHPGGAALIGHLLTQLSDFVGNEWVQEDDVTFVTLERKLGEGDSAKIAVEDARRAAEGWSVLDEFALRSEPGNERQAMERVVKSVEELQLPQAQIEKLKTAVAEAAMNAMEHGNKYQSELPVEVRVLASPHSLIVRIMDQGGGSPIPDPKTPDLEAKLSGEQTPRGWGLFLIKNMVDELNVHSDETHHTIELIMRLEGGDHAS